MWRNFQTLSKCHNAVVYYTLYKPSELLLRLHGLNALGYLDLGGLYLSSIIPPSLDEETTYTECPKRIRFRMY
jgi:hypothetical protein